MRGRLLGAAAADLGNRTCQMTDGVVTGPLAGWLVLAGASWLSQDTQEGCEGGILNGCLVCLYLALQGRATTITPDEHHHYRHDAPRPTGWLGVRADSPSPTQTFIHREGDCANPMRDWRKPCVCCSWEKGNIPMHAHAFCLKNGGRREKKKRGKAKIIH